MATSLISRAVQTGRRLLSQDTVILASMLVIVVCTLAFIEIFAEVRDGDIHAFDRYVLELAGKHRGPPWLQDMGRDITALGATSVLTLATMVVIGFLVLRRQYHAVWLMLAATIGGYLLSSSLKEFIGRERPSIFAHGDNVSTWSFPSGHAMMSTVVYLTLGTLLASLVKERHIKVYIFAATSLLVFSIGLSRVYLGVHWPTDILAGWSAGLVWALLCSALSRYLQRKGVVEKEKKAEQAPTS